MRPAERPASATAASLAAEQPLAAEKFAYSFPVSLLCGVPAEAGRSLDQIS